MNPTVELNNAPPEVQEAIKAAIAAGKQPDPEPTTPEVANPYSDRAFVATEGYPGRRREVLIYPNTDLELKSVRTEYFGPGLDRLAADLVRTATACDAAGISAIQVGVPIRMCVVRISKLAEFVVLVNPVVSPSTPTTTKQLVTEGCLSFPGIQEKVERYQQVDLRYQDLKGEAREMTLTIDDPATASAAQAVQHEVEHLEGVLLTQNVNSIHRDRIRTHMKQVHRKLDTIWKKSGKRYGAMQVLFGYAPDPEKTKPESAPAEA